MSRIASFVAFLLLAACMTSRVALTDHPLAGRIWDPSAARFLSLEEALARLDGAEVILLGETHDNPEHHRIQLELLGRVAAHRPALALEPFDAEHQPSVDAAREPGATAQRVMEAGRMAKGWDRPLYEPLVAFALSRGLPLVAANLSRQRAREVAARGFEALDAGEPARLRIEAPWNEERNRALRRLLVDAHCGQDLPHIDGLVSAQRARDAVIADRILSAHGRVVAILGAGHARRDLGVPLYLAERAPARSVLSVGLVEGQQGDLLPRDYLEAKPGVHDLVWFTARAVRDDPCRPGA